MLAWKAKENKNTKTSKRWYVGWIVFSIILLAIALLEKSPIMVIAFVLISAVLLILKQSPNKKVNCRISKKGIKVNGKIYLFEALRSFSLSKNELTLNFRKIISPTIKIPLRKNKKEVEAELKQKLPKEKRGKDVIDALIEKIGL